ncbi:hypothetical protein D3H64_05015 [Atopobacter sp. AH10]|uniref:hypothetical protein n=1 Tax=Atopobacter sp. AH10 TaxID=2315861 RepID=UPI000EF1EDBE|nr:hypothetical protein [Atopobacter sp. AH10]RLK63344.1 hypothetical protein D3H64_05015 [Atopobacter sp. AH10]
MTINDFFQSLNRNFQAQGAVYQRKVAKPIKSLPKKLWPSFYILLTLAWAMAYFVSLPPLNWQSLDTWGFFIPLVGSYIFLHYLHRTITHPYLPAKQVFKPVKLYLKAVAILFFIGLLVLFFTSPIFNAKAYSRLITPHEGKFEKAITETKIEQVPIIDRGTAQRLGNRKLGTITDLVSQFEPSPAYTQINVANKPVRVSPLRYAGFFKWLANSKQGIPNYLSVDMTDGEVKLMKPRQAMKYTESEYFFRQIDRYLRFNYPTKIFGHPSFEVDDKGDPYYIATTYRKNFLLRSMEPNGAVLVNAMDGSHHFYNLKDIPNWVDRVYSSKIVVNQLNQHGLFKNGFFNSILAKKGATKTTKGYNYIVLNDDVWLYTGITSVTSDDSNIGFVLTNMRTKETKQFNVPAAEEYSAMQSAQGAVQEKSYKSTFPILINKNNRPTYIMSLKDKAGLVKMYAMVDAQDYQKVATGSSLQAVMANYDQSHLANSSDEDEKEEQKTITGILEDKQSVVIDGKTVYYLLIDGEVYYAPVSINDRLPFVQKGQKLSLKVDHKKKAHEVKLETN